MCLTEMHKAFLLKRLTVNCHFKKKKNWMAKVFTVITSRSYDCVWEPILLESPKSSVKWVYMCFFSCGD